MKNIEKLRILGVDPGITRCGLGCVEVDGARRVNLVKVGVVRTSKELPVLHRLKKIADDIDKWIVELKPDILCVEKVFSYENMQTVTTTMQAMGIAMLAAANHNIGLAIHTPTEIKAAVTGFGGADKLQVQSMVAKILGLKSLPKPADAADALAIAICHAWRGTGIQGVSEDGAISISASGGLRQSDKLTPAQIAWAKAEAASRQAGVQAAWKARRKNKS